MYSNGLIDPRYQLMLTLTHVERECARTGKREKDESIGWVLDGKAFVIRNKDRFCKTWVPIFFGQAKMSSFTRKLYRWGFRKVNLAPDASSPSALYFGSENFQRDNKRLLSRMRSITAAKTRSEMAVESSRGFSMVQSADVGGFPAQLTFQVHFGNQVGGLQNSQPPPPVTSGGLLPGQHNPTLEQTAIIQHALAVAQIALQNQQIQQHQPPQFGGGIPEIIHRSMINPQQQPNATPNELLLALSRLSLPQPLPLNHAMNSGQPFSSGLASFNPTQQQQPQQQQLNRPHIQDTVNQTHQAFPQIVQQPQHQQPNLVLSFPQLQQHTLQLNQAQIQDQMYQHLPAILQTQQMPQLVLSLPQLQQPSATQQQRPLQSLLQSQSTVVPSQAMVQGRHEVNPDEQVRIQEFLNVLLRYNQYLGGQTPQPPHPP
jgi:HSF-type DNA-binding